MSKKQCFNQRGFKTNIKGLVEKNNDATSRREKKFTKRQKIF